MAELLNVIDLSAPGAETRQTAVVLHGILGSAKNWRTFGRRLCARFPQWRILLVDLPNHGDSPRRPSPNTLGACVDDLEALSSALHLEPQVVIGHSYGGKVALEWAARPSAHERTTWVLDTNPGAAREDQARVSSTQVVEVLRALQEIPQPLSSREALVEWLQDRGFSGILAQWMTTNLRRDDGGFWWRFSLPGVREMIDHYAVADFLGDLESGRLNGRIELVRAGRTTWPEGDVARLQHMDSDVANSLSYRVLDDCGHWIHVERPNELLAMLEPSFEPTRR